MLRKQRILLVKGQQAMLYTGSIAGAPLVVLNTYMGNGPGVDSAITVMSIISSCDIHRFFSTQERSISEIMA